MEVIMRLIKSIIKRKIQTQVLTIPKKYKNITKIIIIINKSNQESYNNMKYNNNNYLKLDPLFLLKNK
jgi:hypothetical protein